MEIWKDYQTGKYYRIDKETGRQRPSDRYGKEYKEFIPYLTGYFHKVPSKSVPVESSYKVQPKKFDGYFQFPRPSDPVSSVSHPRIVSKQSPRFLIKDRSKIPNPLNFLTISKPKSKRLTPNKSFNSFISNSNISITIDKIKQTNNPKPLKILRTSSELHYLKDLEKQNSLGYIMPKPKIHRKKLKGYFLKAFKNPAEMCAVEKKIINAANPGRVQRLYKLEQLDKITLEKKLNPILRREPKVKYTDKAL
jgi:hypothetical protein